MTTNSWIILTAVVLIVLIAVFVLRKARSRQHMHEDDGSDSLQLYVGNLSYSLRDYQLKEIFSDFGEVSSVRIINHPQSRRSKGFGFVTFESPKSIKKALKMHGKELNGRSLVVRIANPRS